jgi:hypothetical protein
MSVVPKHPGDLEIKFVDEVSGTSVPIRALPAMELILALPPSYPSHSRPLFYQENDFYSGAYKTLITNEINQKWSEEMPVLYEIAIFLQDEFMEIYMSENEIKNEMVVKFETGQLAHKYLGMAQTAYRRQFDEEQHQC